MIKLSRRAVLAGSAITAGAAALPGTAFAQIDSGDEILELWPSAPPGSGTAPPPLKIEDHAASGGARDRIITGIARPFIVVVRPAKPNGAAMLVVPGGAYMVLAYDNEGMSQAKWLADRGITAFVLMYRLPGEGWQHRADVPLQDAQRAMRLIRSRASRWKVDPERLGVLGFSAGGHLAGSLATGYAEEVYQPVDEADRLGARPRVAGLIYPVVSMEAPFSHSGSRDTLIGTPSTPELRRNRSLEHRVTAATPPLFLVHACNDDVVPVENSIALFGAMRASQRPIAMHLFEDGGHGFGAHLPPQMQGAAWPELFMRFAATHGLIG